VDGWYFLVMAGVLAASAFAAIPAALAGHWWAFVILVAPFGLMTWNLLSTSYVISADTLSVRCMLFRKSIPLSSISRLRGSRDLRSSPALSLYRIEVLAGTDSVLVSPSEQQDFVDAIRARQPSVVI
jgi:hypothetical protein